MKRRRPRRNRKLREGRYTAKILGVRIDKKGNLRLRIKVGKKLKEAHDNPPNKRD